jgi:hypothetical protein
MLVVDSAYSGHLDLCLYFYCLCFIIVLYRGNASKLVDVVWECYTLSHYARAPGHALGLGQEIAFVPGP